MYISKNFQNANKISHSIVNYCKDFLKVIKNKIKYVQLLNSSHTINLTIIV